MDSAQPNSRRYCSQAMLIALAVTLGSLLVGAKPFGKGFVLAAIFSVINFRLLLLLAPRKISRSTVKNGLRAMLSLTLRLVLLAVPLIVAVRNPSLNFVATALGLFAVQYAIMAEHVLKPYLLGRS